LISTSSVKRESFLADHAWKLMWGLPAAIPEFSLTFPLEFGIQKFTVAGFGCRLGRYVGPGSDL